MSSAAELMKGMMKREFYAVSSTPLVPPAELAANLEAHLRYLIDLEKRGVLFASGPLFGEDGVLTGEGLTILRAGSMEEAERLAQGDPFVATGQRRFVVKRWIVNEGRITVSVDLSDRVGAIP